MHPNQELAVIAGQGTIALEVLEQVREMHSPAPAGAQQKGVHKVSEALTLPFCTGTPGKCSGGTRWRWRNGCRNSSRHQGRQQLTQEPPCGKGRTLKAGSSFKQKDPAVKVSGCLGSARRQQQQGLPSPLPTQKQGTGTYWCHPGGSSCSPQALRPDVKVFAAEPSNVDDCYQSKVRGELTPNLHPRDTIADAVKTSIGPNTWPIIRDLVDDVLTVSEEEIKVKAPSSLLTAAAFTPALPLCSHPNTPRAAQAPVHPCSCDTHAVSSWKGLLGALPSLPRVLQRCPGAACAGCWADSCYPVPTASNVAGVGKDEAAD